MSTQQHRRSPVSRRDRLFQPRTIKYTCKRCGLAVESQPLPTNPGALRVYGLPTGWELGSALEFAGVLPKTPPEQEDFCLCESCTTDVRKGYPLDLRDLGRSR